MRTKVIRRRNKAGEEFAKAYQAFSSADLNTAVEIIAAIDELISLLLKSGPGYGNLSTKGKKFLADLGEQRKLQTFYRDVLHL